MLIDSHTSIRCVREDEIPTNRELSRLKEPVSCYDAKGREIQVDHALIKPGLIARIQAIHLLFLAMMGFMVFRNFRVNLFYALRGLEPIQITPNPSNPTVPTIVDQGIPPEAPVNLQDRAAPLAFPPPTAPPPAVEVVPLPPDEDPEPPSSEVEDTLFRNAARVMGSALYTLGNAGINAGRLAYRLGTSIFTPNANSLPPLRIKASLLEQDRKLGFAEASRPRSSIRRALDVFPFTLCARRTKATTPSSKAEAFVNSLNHEAEQLKRTLSYVQAAITFFKQERFPLDKEPQAKEILQQLLLMKKKLGFYLNRNSASLLQLNAAHTLADTLQKMEWIQREYPPAPKTLFNQAFQLLTDSGCEAIIAAYMERDMVSLFNSLVHIRQNAIKPRFTGNEQNAQLDRITAATWQIEQLRSLAWLIGSSQNKPLNQRQAFTYVDIQSYLEVMSLPKHLVRVSGIAQERKRRSQREELMDEFA